ncbi:MAG: right-handed parallel beta-helix repeat-containing protein [Planctomycetes bacterium]|nr:right-handed parallel beta-helix repeat-containing protein [Planctomycetota bacterium]
MRSIALLFLAMIALPTPQLRAEEGPLELYVATDGDDASTGRSPVRADHHGPFRTLTRARDTIRGLKRYDPTATARGCVVHLAAGRWSERLELTDDDSAVDGTRIRWQGAGAGTTVLSGGIPITGWTPWRGAILSAPLAGRRPTQLFAADLRQIRARYPNRDADDRHGGAWAHVAGVASPNELRSFRHGRHERHDWAHPTDGSVAVFSGFDWAFRIVPLASYDPATYTITLAAKTWCPLRPGDRYIVEGLMEELDVAGEWCVDQRADSVHWWPPAGVDPASVEIGGDGPVVRLVQTAGIAISDLTIAGCDGDAVRIEGGRGNMIERCGVGACGGTAIVIAGGSSHAVSACEVSGAGESGITAAGGDRTAVTAGSSAGFTAPGGHVIADNDVHDCGQVWRTYRPGIAVTGVGNTIARNHVHDLPHAGITFAGNEHVVEFNHVHHLNRESADTGGLYFCSRDWTQRGNVIRSNSFHDCGGYGKSNTWKPVTDGAVEFRYPGYTWGVYLDDPSCGTQVIGNVFDRVPVCAMHNHGGSDNVWSNNIVIDCPAIAVGTLAKDWEHWPKIIETWRTAVRTAPDLLERYPALAGIDALQPERVSGVRFERNIVVMTVAGTAWLREQHPEWNGAMPLYHVSLRDDDLAANRWDANCLWIEAGLDARVQLRHVIGGKPGTPEMLTWQAWLALGQDRGSQLADPGFTDLAGRDLSLRPDAAARALGFEPIPFERIGPRHRPSWRSAAPPEPPVRQRFVLDEPHP